MPICNHVERDTQGIRWHVGERVRRRCYLKDRKILESASLSDSYLKAWKHGMVIRCYSMTGCQHGPYPELYDVRWDDGTVGHSYLGHGLLDEPVGIPRKNIKKSSVTP